MILKKFLWLPITLLCKSLRISYINKPNNEVFEKPCVIAFWHGSMLVGWYVHRPTANRVSALVSQSNDGKILSAVLQKWNYEVIRGSSHRGGKEAMDTMVEMVNSGSSVCITPDGSNGPRHEMKMGAVRLAQKTGVALILVGIVIEKKKVLNSWDTFEIPFPFTKVNVHYSEPIMIPSDLQGKLLDEFLLKTQNYLNKLSET